MYGIILYLVLVFIFAAFYYWMNEHCVLQMETCMFRAEREITPIATCM